MSDPTVTETPPEGGAEDPFATAVSDWYAALQHQRGDRAALRRAQSVDDVYGVIAFHILLRRLGESLAPDTVARLAIALATVEADRDGDEDETEEPAPEGGGRRAGWGGTFGRAAATPNGGKPRVSEERMRRLLSAEDPDQFLRLLRGVLHLLDRKVPLTDLARVVRSWHSPSGRPRVRRQIFLSYFATILPPETTDA